MQGGSAFFEAFAVSTGVVALGEIGDKTQLLALLLAARFRKPRPIIAGILVATLLNHALAGALGVWLTTVINPTWSARRVKRCTAEPKAPTRERPPPPPDPPCTATVRPASSGRPSWLTTCTGNARISPRYKKEGMFRSA